MKKYIRFRLFLVFSFILILGVTSVSATVIADKSFSGSVNYFYSSVSSGQSYYGGSIANNDSRYSVDYIGSNSGDIFKAWFRIYSQYSYYNGVSNLLSQGTNFSNKNAYMVIQGDYDVIELQAHREHIINPPRNVYGNWGFGQ